MKPSQEDDILQQLLRPQHLNGRRARGFCIQPLSRNAYRGNPRAGRRVSPEAMQVCAGFRCKIWQDFAGPIAGQCNGACEREPKARGPN